ncbi:hypothetical protein AC244_20310 [Ensifer adhaerens]|uniref:Polysaccharide pyruvyl transferase domain-containing protein n=1 Tax=Ensifer adhaerens TaxID=106592 RepID=A0A0L8BQN2_ENSAD|nr:polysaccharide pyruvyl transferase family protein [Ensifer adhaerens]KOF16893.1 hypothetical protein AC244_20310 [Ensifer adhaerens]
MKIVIFNVKYSENLGDGILAQCLETALARGGGGLEVKTIDLAGRTAFGTGGGGRRRLLLKVLQALPSFARRLVVRQALGPTLRRLQVEWQKEIDDADAVVIGGGNLFQDDDLNFPLKVGAALDCVKRSGKPLAVYAVGTSRDWSSRARQLFGVLEESQLVHVSVRDTIAGRNWLGHFPAGPHARILPDPGLLVREIVASHALEPLKVDDRAIGICVTDPLILRRHSSHGSQGIPFRHADDYHQLLDLMLDAGYRVCLFTNGAQEDQAFARRVLNGGGLAAHIDSGNLYLAPRPKTPEELIHILASTQVILAHRLHACIAAYSLGVPQVGLGWDPKVDGFFQFVGRSEYFAGEADISAQHVASLLEEAARKGIDPAVHGSVLHQAREGISQLQDCLVAHQNRGVSRKTQPVVATNDRGMADYAWSNGL